MIVAAFQQPPWSWEPPKILVCALLLTALAIETSRGSKQGRQTLAGVWLCFETCRRLCAGLLNPYGIKYAHLPAANISLTLHFHQLMRLINQSSFWPCPWAILPRQTVAWASRGGIVACVGNQV